VMIFRIFDIFFTSLAIIVLFPFILPVIIALKFTGEHFIFYLQPRIGKGGKEFKLLKFATMKKDSPNLPGGFLTQKNDPRVLPLGKFLRATKINELPQLINIFLGQMSIVGPRPMVLTHLELYPKEIQKEILNQRPGLTGIGSIIFRDEEGILDKMGGDRNDKYDKIIAPYKGEVELWYSEHRSVRLYFLLVFLTVCTVIRPNSKLYQKCFKDLPTPPKELENFL
jgi:lipopolysaccharide/colanic/teichoic acid biosynthesis glycosyltransferase